jgi:hypothetical protein
MSISSQTVKIGPTTIAGLPQVIAVSFPFQAGADLLVLDTGASGVGSDPARILTLGSDYTVTGGGYNGQIQMQTGSITVSAGGAGSVLVGDQIVIIRAPALNQTTVFTPAVPLTPAYVEQALDKMATLAQEVNELASRGLHFENFEFGSTLLSVSARKSKVIGFDASGNLTYYSFVSGAVAPQSIAGTAGQVLVNGATAAVTGAVTLSLAGGTPSIQGTANQILVNGLTTAVTTFPVVLTLPQSIGTASTVQFQKLGIGVAVGVNSDVNIIHSVPAITAQASLLISGALAAPVATDLHPNAFRDTTVYTSTVDADAYACYDAQAQEAGARNYNHFIGYQARQAFTGSGTLSRLEGFTASMTVNAPGGTVTEARAFYVPDLIVTAGTVTHFAGLYIDQLTKGTTRHAIYHNGTDPWFSAGGQIFTSSLLTTPAGATTCLMGCTFDQAAQTGLAVMNKSVTATGTFASFCNSGGTVQGTITQTNATTTAYNTSSDSRLKENVRDLTDSGALLDAIMPRIFDWNWGGKNYHGFIAQELNLVFPEAVTVGDENMTVRPWQVDMTKLVPVLTAEIKSLRARVAQLEAA